MEAAKKTTTDLVTSSAAAFVEGGVQEACDDACSICLENFTTSDPSAVTNCKHEFHLQCILEWCQRSSNCPMCWQRISLRDSTSQQLLEAVEEERTLRTDRLRNTENFLRPRLVDFDLQLPTDASEVDLEDQIFQHLAAAVRRGGILRRDGQGNWSSSRGEHPFFIFSAPTDNSVGSESTSYRNTSDNRIPTIYPCRPQIHQTSAHSVGPNVASDDQQQSPSTTSFASRSSQGSEETGQQSEFQSFSETLRSRLNNWSMRYKESISRNTRGWKERLFSRNTSMTDAGIASVSRLIERLDARNNVVSRHSTGTSNSSESHAVQSTEH